MTQTITLDYQPRRLFLPFHSRQQRWAAMVVHRRGGKTVACVNELVNRAIRTKKSNARYAYLAPFYRQAKDVAWQYLKDFAKPLIKKIRESELRVELINGAWITLYGADNPDALRGLYFDGVILDEYGDCRPSLWGTVILPTLVDRKGWAVFIGTPKGKNHFYRIANRARTEEGWFFMAAPASKTGIIAPEELGEMRAQMSDEEYDQEMECSFEAAIKGAYFAHLLTTADGEGRIDPGPLWDPNQLVHTAADIGRSDATAVWFWQERPDGVAVIDYEEIEQGSPAKFNDTLRSKPYEYGEVWLPHDAKAKTFATSRSTIEQVHDFGYDIRLGPKLAKMDTINAARSVIPICWFSEPMCLEGLDALRSYRPKFDETNQVWSDKPLHDWASHGADGFQLLSLVVKEKRPDLAKTAKRGRSGVVVTPGTHAYNVTLDQLFTDRESDMGRNYNTLRIGG